VLIFCQDLFIITFFVADFRSVNVKIHKEKNGGVVHLPGFKYDDFDRAGILAVCICSRECDSCCLL